MTKKIAPMVTEITCDICGETVDPKLAAEWGGFIYRKYVFDGHRNELTTYSLDCCMLCSAYIVQAADELACKRRKSKVENK